ncbi:MAG: hypothetical protein ACUVX8_09770 [Candidatus Zipacnadales bacterium]
MHTSGRTYRSRACIRRHTDRLMFFAGTWEIAARWACNTRWSWFAGWGENDVAAWNKHFFDGDVTVDYYVALKMDAPGGSETERCRDLNTVLCGDRNNVRSGYSFILGGDAGVKTQLLRNGVPVAQSTELRVPPGWGSPSGMVSHSRCSDR